MKKEKEYTMFGIVSELCKVFGELFKDCDDSMDEIKDDIKNIKVSVKNALFHAKHIADYFTPKKWKKVIKGGK